jgi:hypothetical protein
MRERADQWPRSPFEYVIVQSKVKIATGGREGVWTRACAFSFHPDSFNPTLIELSEEKGWDLASMDYR